MGDTKRAKYLDHIRTIAANLMKLHFNRLGEYVYYSRDNNLYHEIKRYNPNNITIRKIKKVIKLLIDKQLIDHRKGFHNKYSKKWKS